MIAAPTHVAGDRPLSVAHLIWGLETGGSQRAILSTLLHGTPLGLRQRVIAFHGGSAAPLIEEAGGRVTLIGKRRGLDRAALARLAADLARDKPDLLHCHDFTACFWGNRAADRAGIHGRVATLHSWMLGLPWPKRFLYLRELRRMDRVIALSAATRARLRGHGFGRKVLADLPVGPDPSAGDAGAGREASRAALGLDHATVAVFTAARLEPGKNLPLLVELARRLGDDCPPLRFLVAGEGNRRGELERLIGRRGLAGHVTLLGLRHDIPALLAAADLFLLPSRSEELPLSVLEAMAAGLPVVAAPVGALPEVVAGEPAAGFLVPPADRDEWVARVRTLAADPALRRAMGEEGRRRVAERFNARRNVAALAACYRDVAGERP